jgi:hypothetical protein
MENKNMKKTIAATAAALFLGTGLALAQSSEPKTESPPPSSVTVATQNGKTTLSGIYSACTGDGYLLSGTMRAIIPASASPEQVLEIKTPLEKVMALQQKLVRATVGLETIAQVKEGMAEEGDPLAAINNNLIGLNKDELQKIARVMHATVPDLAAQDLAFEQALANVGGRKVGILGPPQLSIPDAPSSACRLQP